MQASFVLYVPVPIGGGGRGTDAVAASFTPAVKAALIAGMAQALGVDAATGVFITSITPYTYRRRRRSLYMEPSAGTGVSLSTGILASAAASSLLVKASLGSGVADVSSVMSATIAVVQSQMASGALAAAIAAQPVVITGLGYTSSEQLVAQLALDGAPFARMPPPPGSSLSAPALNIALLGGAVGGGVAAVILIALAARSFSVSFTRVHVQANADAVTPDAPPEASKPSDSSNSSMSERHAPHLRLAVIRPPPDSEGQARARAAYGPITTTPAPKYAL